MVAAAREVLHYLSYVHIRDPSVPKACDLKVYLGKKKEFKQWF